jgi:TP901 family phage tail tape measure protein
VAGKFTLEAVFRAVDKLSAPVRRMASGLDKFQQKASKSLSDLDVRVSKVTGSLRTMATVAGIAGIAAGAVALNVGKTGADFEQAITNVGAVSLVTRDQIAELEAKALELGATTKFSATEVANAMEMMGKAGFENEEVLSGVGGILAAAAAEGAGLEETASNVSNVLKGMGLAVTESTRVADVLTLASARTNSSISSLGESMKNVSSTARQLGVPLEDTVAMVALLQDVGLDASEAGSATATMLTKLAAPSKEAAAQMRAMGVAFQDSAGNMLAPEKVLGQLVKSAQKSGGNMKQVAFFAELVGMRGQKAALNLQELFKKGKFQGLTEKLAGAAGSAEKMANIRMDTLLGDVEQLGGSVDSFKIALYNTQAGPLRGVVQGMREWLEANQEVIKSGIVDFINAAIPVVTGFGKGLLDAFRGALPFIKGLSSALGIFSGESVLGAEARSYLFAQQLFKLGSVLLGLIVVVKAAQAAVFAFGAVTKAVQATVFLFTGAIKGAQAALVLYQTWTKAGAVGTIALQFATKAAAVDLVVAKVAAYGAAGGFAAMAVPILAVAAALASLKIAWDQLESFMNENGGWEGLKAFVGAGEDSTDFGFSAVDNLMNKQARDRRINQDVQDMNLGNVDRPAPYTPAEAARSQAVDNIFGVSRGPQGMGAPEGAGPSPAQPQPASPWGEFAPQDMRDLFKGTIDVNIKDPGKNVDSVDVKNPGKTLAPKNPRSGTP